MAAELPARDSVCPGCPRPPLPREAEVLIVKRDCRGARSLARACAGVLPHARIAMLHDASDAEVLLRRTENRLVVVGACLADHTWWPRLTRWAGFWPRSGVLLVTDVRCPDAIRSLVGLGRVSLHNLCADREADLLSALRESCAGGRWLGASARAILAGGRTPALEHTLSPIERMVLCLVGMLRDDRAIARKLGLTLSAARKQRERVAQRVDARGRTALVRTALRHGYVAQLDSGKIVPGLTHWLRDAGCFGPVLEEDEA
jgi:DNA-binding CsgD family transcriptional regulator